MAFFNEVDRPPTKGTNTMRSTAVYRALGASAAGTCLLAGLYASPASAAEPPPAACVGTSFSALASGAVDIPVQPNGSEVDSVGELMVFVAQVGGPLSTQPGAGDTLANLRAGLIPDFGVPNTCND
jgi:hypothetical protein